MIASVFIMSISSIAETTSQLEIVNGQSLFLAAVLGTGAVVLSRRQLRKAKRKLMWAAVKNIFRRKTGSGDGKGALKLSLIILGVLLAAMMIYFLSWIGIILVVLCLPLLFIGKKRRRKY